MLLLLLYRLSLALGSLYEPHPKQWYLKDDKGDRDINVLPAWKSGLSGRGVSIALIDDGKKIRLINLWFVFGGRSGR